MPVDAVPRSEAKDPPVADRGLRSRGMRDLGPDEMRRFRHVERVFLETTAARGYREIRTPTIEPLHLFTASGALSPQALDRVYSFLDWDGWSGERVVLRPEATVAAARWVVEAAAAGSPQRLCYVQAAYRFAPGDADREIWQCGVELFGLPAAEADAELLVLARDLLVTLGLRQPACELGHAGLARAVFAAAGLSATDQLDAYDRMLDGDLAVADQLAAARPEASGALRLLADVDGTSLGYVANLRAALLPAVPAAARALDELAAAAAALEGARVPYRVRPGTARNFEYYTGVTFRMRDGEVECVTGGRYDGLAATIGGPEAPGSGFAADLLRLAEIVPAPGGAWR
ncbi:MAG: ATP phosphoribosyltransferase regulatory subunit [Chloroflexi bacterium]|nr:ATP phosphoribosyltransferase regulatory subunit [Chloroflexota bacterium]